MEVITNLIAWFVDFVLHMDKHLDLIVRSMGLWSYALLFLVIFVETGVVIMPFLPGDSLLFAAGSLAALGSLNPVVLFVALAVAAILGDRARTAPFHPRVGRGACDHARPSMSAPPPRPPRGGAPPVADSTDARSQRRAFRQPRSAFAHRAPTKPHGTAPLAPENG